MLYRTQFVSPIGNMEIKASDWAIKEIKLSNKIEIAEKETPLLKEAKQQLSEYFRKERKIFDLPLDLAGTPFQKTVWAALLNIPYGETCSYKEIAQMINNEKAFRAVGHANNANPIMIIVPCHRVIGSNGSLIGYNGGIDIKKFLLALEASN